MKGCRDGKSAKTSATRNCLYGAVVDMIFHPYTPSFHEMIFILVSLILPLGVVKLECQGTPKMHYACVHISENAPLLSKPHDKAMASFRGQFWPLVDLYLVYFDWKVQRFCWPKGTSLECTCRVDLCGNHRGRLCE